MMQDIPGTSSGLADALAQDPLHPGLQAAFSSFSNDRHPYAATFMLLGATGAGKSSTTNSLFGDVLAETGDTRSVSKQIVEYTIRVPLDELQVSNSTLTVVDTPGFGDTSVNTFDAQLLASLHSFLHSEHQHALTCILIVCSFADARFQGENSSFVKMLKAVEYLKDKEKTVMGKASIVFVLTHFMHGKKADLRQPERRVSDFASVIQEFTGLTEPVILLAENAAEDQELPLNSNGFYNLPNGEAFPYNIFKGIQDTICPVDPMGEAIIRAAYKDIQRYGPPLKIISELLPPSHPNVTACETVLTQIHRPIRDNPINRLVSQVWLKWPGGQLDDPDLVATKVLLQRKQIFEMENLPRTPLEIMDLARQLPTGNPKMVWLLREAFGMHVPELSEDIPVGKSYDIVNDSLLSTSIFETNPQDDVIGSLGFSIPCHLSCKQREETVDRIGFFEDSMQFVLRRLEDLGSITVFKGTYRPVKFPLRVSYNVPSGLRIQNFTALREYRLFSLSLKQESESYLSPQFKQAVEALPPFLPNNTKTVQKYREFFQTFGTHIVSRCHGGGVLELEAKRTKWLISSGIYACIQSGLSMALLNIFEENDISGDKDLESLRQDFDIIIELRGGSPRMDGQQVIFKRSKKRGPSASEMKQWRESLVQHPVGFQTEMQLIPVSHFAGKVYESATQQLREAAEHLLLVDLGYNRENGAPWQEPVEPQIPVARRFEPNRVSNSFCKFL